MRKALQIRDMLTAARQQKRARRKVESEAKAQCRRARRSYRGTASYEWITAPVAVSIQGKASRRLTLAFIGKVRRSVLFDRRPVLLNFRHTIKMFAAGTLLLIAELDRMKRVLGSVFNVRIIFSDDAIVNQVIYQVGIAELCGYSTTKEAERNFDDSVRHWRYATGVQMNDTPGRAIERFEGRLSANVKTGVWKGVSEAVVNSVQHAYLAERGDAGPPLGETRWWMFSHEKDGLLSVVVCDLGIGIPRSLPIKWGEDIISRALERFGLSRPDLAAVRIALEVGQTRTGQDNRGRGLPQIWNEMVKSEGGSIAIMSNKAVLMWSSQDRKETGIEFASNIQGTLIAWTVPLQERIA